MTGRITSYLGMSKTYKRETAWGVLCAFWGAVLAVAGGYTPDSHLDALQGLLGSAALPVHILAAAMFGVDWYGKQGPGRHVQAGE